MRVAAFLLGTANPHGLSGGDRFALEVLRSWHDDFACDVSLAVSSAGADVLTRFNYAIPHVVVEREATRVGAYRSAYLGRALRGLQHARHIRRGCDIVFAASAYFYDVLPALALARRANSLGARPRIVAPIFHVILPPQRRAGNAFVNAAAFAEQRAMIALAARACDTVVVDNARLGRDLARIAPRIAPAVYQTAMGVPARDARVGALRSLDMPARYAVYVGRLSAAKGLATLLDAWCAVRASGEALGLVLAGSPDASFDVAAELRRRALGGETVVVRVGARDDEVAAIVREAEFAVSASPEEGYGLAIAEALALGAPCVTFDLAAFRELFPTGRRVARNFSAEAFAREVVALARDGDARAALRAEIARDYRFVGWTQVARDLLERVVAGSPDVPKTAR